MTAFPWGQCVYIVYILVSLIRVCVVYIHVVKEVQEGGLGQLMGVVHNRTYATD